MRHRRLIFIFVLAVVAAALLAPAAFATAPPAHGSGMLTYGQAVDYLFAKGYPQNVETYLTSLGTSPLGYRLAGTPSDNAAAFYIRDKLRGMGLSNVHLERVPVDVWDVRGASVTVDDTEYVCSQFAGIPGVDEPLTAGVAYLGSGLAADYEGVDVKGKIVLIDSSMDNFWISMQGAEATKHGAAAVILTSNYSDPDPEYPSFPWYSWASDALGGNDGEYDMSWAPMIYLSQKDGDTLKAKIAAAAPDAVSATFASDVRITMADDGGFGYNVVATLPGSAHNGQKVILNAHHDSHLRAGMDDTGAVSNTLAMAKAMTLSDYRPKRDIVFLFDTAEEFGYTNSWYDWSIGAWHFITKAHPGWAGHIAAMWSIELMAAEGAKLDFNTSPELATWIDQNASAGQAAGLLSNGYTLKTPQNTWQNGWSFQGMGVPSFEVSAGGADYDLLYHSTYEVQSLLDWDYMANIDKFFYRMFRDMDRGALPYDFAARGADLKAAVDSGELQAAGVSAKAADHLAALAAGIEEARLRVELPPRQVAGEVPHHVQPGPPRAGAAVPHRVPGAGRLGLHLLPAPANDVGHRVHGLRPGSPAGRSGRSRCGHRGPDLGRHQLVHERVHPKLRQLRSHTPRPRLLPGHVGFAGQADQPLRHGAGLGVDRRRAVRQGDRQGPEDARCRCPRPAHAGQRHEPHRRDHRPVAPLPQRALEMRGA